MKEIREYKCVQQDMTGIDPELAQRIGLSFPLAHVQRESIISMARAIRDQGADKENGICVLPFCHTLEAEGLGAHIRYGDSKTGPRAGEYRYHTLDELETLPDINFQLPRIQEMLAAAHEMVLAGDQVVFEVCGPLTVLSLLVDPKVLFKGMRREPDRILRIFRWIGDQLLGYINRIVEQGVQLISYADVVGSVSILGPALTEWLTDSFTVGFLREMERVVDSRAMILLCPKLTLILTGMDQAYLKNHLLPEEMSYQRACIYMKGTCALGGQSCVKNTAANIKIFKEIKLKNIKPRK